MVASNLGFFVVRTDNSIKPWITSEIREGRLHQGWGCTGLRLMSVGGDPTGENTWLDEYNRVCDTIWEDPSGKIKGPTRYRILRGLLEIEEGDLVIVPKIPDWEHFTIARAAGSYEWEEKIAEDRDDDHRHVVPIDPNSLVVVGNYSSEQARIVLSKFRAYQSAVNRASNSDFVNAIHWLLENPAGVSDLGIWKGLVEVGESVTQHILSRISKLGNSDIENIVKGTFEALGYEFIQRNSQSEQGGDVDLEFTYNMPGLDSISDSDITVHIQVKKKIGVDEQDMAGLKQLLNYAGENPNTIRILVSTAEQFTPETKDEAQKHGILLMGGKDLAMFLLRNFPKK